MKTKTFLIAAVMFLAFSVAAFAQGTLTVGSIPVTAVVASGLTEKTGDITFNPVASQNLEDGVITIDYGVPITVPGSVCAIGPGCAAVPGVTVILPVVGSVFQIQIEGPLAPVAFRVSGNRVAVAGSGLTSLSANISATGNAIEVGQNNQVPVINAIQPGIGSFTVVTPPGAAAFNSIFGGADQLVTLRVREGFFNAFGPATDVGYTANRATMIRLTLSAIPAGLQLTFPANAGLYFSRTDTSGVPAGADLVLPDLVGTNTVYYMVTTDTPATAIDNLDIGVTVRSLMGPLNPTLGVGSVTAVATFAPIGTASTLPPPQPVPRYIDAPAGPVTIATIVPGATTLLMPYSVNQLGYDTGIAISNTTKDPGAAAMGITETVIAQSGTITFYFYQNGNPVSTYTTQAGSPGAGLDATGKLPAGATYSVLLSEVASFAAPPIPDVNFQGYVFMVCNFTNAHGQYFISDFEFFTNGALMLVIHSDAGTRKGELGLDQ